MRRPAWTRFRRPAIGLAVLAIGGAIVMVSGIVPIEASSGHWAVTRWFLDFAKTRSVATHALGATAPDLDEPWRVLQGAAHYDSGCRPCHGSPDVPPPPIAAAMTPSPPYLPPLMARWEPEELFYIVKHGMKFTGMPAWPSQERDDEVWSMAAFLVTLPDLDAASYERLVHGDAEVQRGTAATLLTEMSDTAPVPGPITLRCARCHGVDGMGRGSPAFPRLAGQSGDYLFGAIAAYARGERNSGTMEPVAADLAPDEWRVVADYYAALPTESAPVAEAHADPRIESGERIASAGVPSQDVPSCMDCHGPSSHSHNPAYPRLAGQHAEYLVLQLELFADDRRGGSAHGHLMDEVAPRLTAEQMRDVAAYYASLPWTATQAQHP